LDGILLETDAPYQPGLQHQGERNEPAFLVETLVVIATLRDRDPAEIAAGTTRNALTLFGIAPCQTLSHAPKF
jgi:TatD DNase family protein